ncbi:MAG: 2,3-bisphosphoglycerate-independent phosphoglycerate mutase [Bacteriovoracaceae bacterium]
MSNQVSSIKGLSKQVLLVILDGFGINPNKLANAIAAAKKPNIDKLFKEYPFTTIQASGELVGLPKGVAGNSEVGHLNLGAGRPVRQDLVRINEVIAKNDLSNMPKMIELIENAKKHSKRIHLMGLLSDGSVHSHIEHLKKIIEVLGAHKDLKVFLHAYMDGRDTAKTNGIKYLEDILKMPNFTLASMQGRAIGMDRDRRYEKILHAYKTFIGEGKIENVDPIKYIQSQYDKGIYDEFIDPILFKKEYAMEKDDCIFFFNFRPDRAKEITLAFTDPNFQEFNKYNYKTPFRAQYYLCMTPYVEDEVKLPILFDKEKLKNTFSDYLSSLKLKQFKIAETEKYAHVTYFFNGGEEKPFAGEDRVLISSPRDVATYDQKPEMSAYLVLADLLKKLDDKQYTFFAVNFANSDMVGHTGNYEAAVKAIEALDNCVGQLMKKCEENGIAVIVTSDHGNSDQMKYEDGTPHTSHTDAVVPFCVFHSKLKNVSLKAANSNQALKDVAPTVLQLLGMNNPEAFTGRSVFE